MGYKKAIIAIFISLINLGCLSNYTPMRVDGNAMLPAFKDGDRMIVQKKFNELKRGDVIVFSYPKDMTKQFFKRVVGLPGETLSIEKGVVSINGEKLDEPYLDQTLNQSESNFPSFNVPDRCYFVIGDNRDNSSDSRSWGVVPEDLIK